MTQTTASDVRRALAAFRWTGLILPLGLLALAEVVIAGWLTELPDPAATHWGAEGVDGFGPRWMVLLNPLIGAAVVLLLAGIVLLSARSPGKADGGRLQWSTTGRFLGAMNLGAGAFIALLALVTAGVQRGLADAADTPDIAGWMLVSAAVSVGLAVVGWFLQPAVTTPPVSAQPATADTLVLSGTERAAWFGSVTLARSGRIVVGSGVLVLLGTTVFAVAHSGWGAAVVQLVSTVLVLLLSGTMLAFRVRVTAKGLQVRSLIGWPNTRIPLDDIAKIEVVPVNPFGEFGGWGWRYGLDGRRGVVLRNGEGLQVTRRSGKVFVVTVDGAEEAAAVLESLQRATMPD